MHKLYDHHKALKIIKVLKQMFRPLNELHGIKRSPSVFDFVLLCCVYDKTEMMSI